MPRHPVSPRVLPALCHCGSFLPLSPWPRAEPPNLLPTVLRPGSDSWVQKPQTAGAGNVTAGAWRGAVPEPSCFARPPVLRSSPGSARGVWGSPGVCGVSHLPAPRGSFLLGFCWCRCRLVAMWGPPNHPKQAGPDPASSLQDLAAEASVGQPGSPRASPAPTVASGHRAAGHAQQQGEGWGWGGYMGG